MKTIIKVENLRKVYRIGEEKVIALQKIDMEIYKGQICCIQGTSGSGKSTLLNMLAGLEKPSKGEVFIGKTPITKLTENELASFRQRYIGFIFQSYNLLPALSAEENVALPLTFKGVEAKKRKALAINILKEVGLGTRINHKPSQISGGQQQRVGIARAFVSKPAIVFADEPTGNLDTKTTRDIMELMVKMARENEQTLIIVTHDISLSTYADRVINLIDGEIVQDITKVPAFNTV